MDDAGVVHKGVIKTRVLEKPRNIKAVRDPCAGRGGPEILENKTGLAGHEGRRAASGPPARLIPQFCRNLCVVLRHDFVNRNTASHTTIIP